MVLNQKPTGRAASIPLGLAFGAVISLGVTIIAAAALASMTEKEIISWDKIGYGIMLLVFAASFLGGISACSKIKRQYLLVCMLSGFLYFGVLLSITALFFGGQFEAVGMTGMLILAGSGAAGILGSNSKRGVRRRKKTRA